MEVHGDFASGDTLLVRERAYPGWRYRVGGGPWRKAPESSDHFFYVPITRPAHSVEFAFVPADFYRLGRIAALVSTFLAVFAGFLRRMRPKRA